jgi:bacteriocin-like protein
MKEVRANEKTKPESDPRLGAGDTELSEDQLAAINGGAQATGGMPVNPAAVEASAAVHKGPHPNPMMPR